MSKYNIFTVLNDGYFKFGKVFVHSIIDRLDLDLIDNIFIYDTGLSKESRSELQICEKVQIVSTGIETKHVKIHDKDWEDNVYSKARLLRHCIDNQENFLPTAMIDCDSIFIDEFHDVWDMNSYDIVACLRSSRGRSSDHISTSTHIGSFFAVNNREAAQAFLDFWISEISNIASWDQKGNYVAKESPALSNAIELYRDSLRIGDLQEYIISNIEKTIPSEAKILHLKSDFGLETVDLRLSQPRAAFYTQRYLANEPT